MTVFDWIIVGVVGIGLIGWGVLALFAKGMSDT
jgi:hypothetical protein